MGGARRTGHDRQGFTLLEVAIVLGIMGIVLAAIFTAATSARYRVAVNQGADEVGVIVDSMRSLYASRNTSALPAQAFSAAFEQTLVQERVFPPEMVAGVVANNPWDATTANGSAQISIVAAGATTPTQFILRYVNLPADVCADLLMRTSMPDLGLNQIQITGGGTVTYTSAANKLPVSAIDAAAACRGGAAYVIDWYFKLGS